MFAPGAAVPRRSAAKMDGSHSTIAAAPARAAAAREMRVDSTALAGAAFVLLWSSGYVAGKVGIEHAGPFSLLLVRFAAAALAFAALAWFARARVPGWRAAAHSAVVGMLSLAVQFGAVYLGVALGAEVGVAALVLGAMPLVTAALAPWFGEHIAPRQWIGLGLGLVGVLLVLADRLHFGGAPALAYALVLLSLLGMSLGTLYQKRHASAIDARVGLAIQHVVAALALLPLAWHEDFRLDGTLTLAACLAWLFAVNSVGGFALLFLLLRRGAANQVAQLFFLIPPVTAVISWLFLGETFTALKLAGFAIAVAGVWLGTRAARAA
jgi:drug/metabolite transporter (DMT)-like permease